MADNLLPRNLTVADAHAMAAAMIERRRALHGDLVMVADDDAGDDAANDDAGDDAANDDAGDDDKLGDAGQRALQAERDRRRQLAADLRPWRELSRDLGLTAEQARTALEAAARGAGTGKGGKGGSGDDEPVDVEAVRREARREALTAANSRLVAAEVRALAADTFADPRDAHLYLDLSAVEVDDDGQVDADEIKRQLADVLADRPHLAKSRRGPKPDRSQGARGKTGAAVPDGAPPQVRLAAAYAASERTT